MLKGAPAVDYGSDELIYLPRNPRPGRIYERVPLAHEDAVRAAEKKFKADPANEGKKFDRSSVKTPQGDIDRIDHFRF